jgi:hypothetical protein
MSDTSGLDGAGGGANFGNTTGKSIVDAGPRPTLLHAITRKK